MRLAVLACLATLGCSSPAPVDDDPAPWRYTRDSAIEQAEEDAWVKRDPIDRVRKYLTARGAWSDSDQAALEARNPRLMESLKLARSNNRRGSTLASMTAEEAIAAAQELARKEQALRAEQFLDAGVGKRLIRGLGPDQRLDA